MTDEPLPQHTDNHELQCNRLFRLMRRYRLAGLTLALVAVMTWFVGRSLNDLLLPALAVVIAIIACVLLALYFRLAMNEALYCEPETSLRRHMIIAISSLILGTLLLVADWHFYEHGQAISLSRFSQHDIPRVQHPYYFWVSNLFFAVSGALAVAAGILSARKAWLLRGLHN